MVIDPYEGWAAQKAGLHSGDVILEVDDKSIKGKSTDEVSKLLKGQAGTKIKLLIRRDGTDKPFVKEFAREDIKVKNVPYYGMLNQNVGYIKYNGFRQDAGEEVKNALIELKKNPNFNALVFDLRGNPGGLLDEAVKTVSIFVEPGQLVCSTKGRVQELNHEYRTSDNPVDTKVPIVVLTDNGSASASEIVSGSLQDLDRAVIVGANTFGKGLVQTTHPLPYNTQMKITTYKYYIPSGRCIQALDYSHKDSAGKAIHYADSLRQAFKTKSGRTVYSGNGIKPDVPVARKQYAEVIKSLGEKRLFFDYATYYRNHHDSIPPVKNFHLTDADFQDFLAFLKNKDYEYNTATEENLKKMTASAKTEKYYDAIKDELVIVEKKLNDDKRADVIKFKEDITNILREEIASRYYYQSGKLQASFDHDNDVQEALKILANQNEYNKILTASK